MGSDSGGSGSSVAEPRSFLSKAYVMARHDDALTIDTVAAGSMEAAAAAARSESGGAAVRGLHAATAHVADRLAPLAAAASLCVRQALDRHRGAGRRVCAAETLVENCSLLAAKEGVAKLKKMESSVNDQESKERTEKGTNTERCCEPCGAARSGVG